MNGTAYSARQILQEGQIKIGSKISFHKHFKTCSFTVKHGLLSANFTLQNKICYGVMWELMCLNNRCKNELSFYYFGLYQ